MGRLHKAKKETTASYVRKYLQGKGFVPSNYAIGTRVITA
jgi:hypothetical protein